MRVLKGRRGTRAVLVTLAVRRVDVAGLGVMTGTVLRKHLLGRGRVRRR